ncbi:Protein FAM89A [Collichthys lucidus]|uniref:Protein FAM89A n=1 Tax=Collichthys lucidus TaxID=240159 RepID=A0A4V6ATT7_COLLU|nr:Protein FAM89A [Collichthys lucidus]
MTLFRSSVLDRLGECPRCLNVALQFCSGAGLTRGVVVSSRWRGCRRSPKACVLSSSGGSWRDFEKVYSKRARIQADISRGGGDEPRGHSKPGGLDAALALLRKKMLWSLHEAIQEYKGSSLLSDASFSADNKYSDEEEEEDEDEEETGVLSQPSSSPSFSLPPPSSNIRDQWIKDSFHFAR